MVFFNIIIFLLLIYISQEEKELRIFGNMEFYPYNKLYLNTSIYKEGDLLKFTLRIYSKIKIKKYSIGIMFENSLNFSKFRVLSTSGAEGTYNWITQEYSYDYSLKLEMKNKSTYLLFNFDYCDFKNGIISHINKPITSAINLNISSSLLINSLSDIYLSNNFQTGDNICFSFSFKSNQTINKYPIYFSFDNYYDFKAFENMRSISLRNPRIKNNKYTFYYDMRTYYKSKKYICLKLGDINGQIKLVNITQLPKLPIELKNFRELTINSNDYVFININKYLNKTELFFKIIASKKLEDLKLKYKYSDEKFYEDFVDMEILNITNITDEKINKYKINWIYYFKLKVNNMTNFLLFEIPKINEKNFILKQLEEDEYQKILEKRQNEEELNKRSHTIILVTVISSVVLIVIIIIIICVNKKKKKSLLIEQLNEENLNNSTKIEENNYVPSSTGPYDNVILKSINYIDE